MIIINEKISCMCYYNGTKVTRSEYIRLKQIEKLVAKYDFLNTPLHIGFEYGPTPVLKRHPDEIDFDIVQMEWGFIPDANKWPFIETREQLDKFRKGFVDSRGKFQQLTMLNAVSEELLLSNKIYREAALKRRCLILSTGFFDWRHIFPKNKRTGKPNKTAVKYPYHVTVKDKEYFYMAGVWQPWTDADTGEYVESCAIVTTEAPKGHIMAKVHNSKKRMPTILTEDLAYDWLFKDLSEKEILETAGYVFDSNLMQACSIKKDFIGQLDPTMPFEYEDLPAFEF